MIATFINYMTFIIVLQINLLFDWIQAQYSEIEVTV